MVEILRNKWCEDLEDILQCPVCMTCPTNSLFHQCTEGHHICQACWQKLPVCPSCGKPRILSRNRLAESLCSKFDDIKLSLIDPEAEVNKLLIPDKLCVATQTDDIQDVTANAAAVVLPVPDEKTCDGPTGVCSCCVGICKIKMCYEELLQHIKSEHSLHFHELCADDNLFQYAWCFDYTEEMTFDKVFRILDIGTFVLKLSTDKCGDLTAFIMMLHSGTVSQQFSYKIQITCGSKYCCSTYTGKVNSYRSPATVFEEKCLRVKSSDIRKVKEIHEKFKCNIILAGKLHQDELNEQNRKRPKRRNKSAKTLIAKMQSVSMSGV